ncbi:phosphoribosylamine-glycine ligase [Acididesulfobacillus acetoxydans]|uniref:Phosphoribosylamine--glycine ligase n=1 Tax=Acididesulfobacillus acetoxydans TaxID=1561005 RepID=A0A8S0WN31_9FIRM|nr:phosphoribosylamine--glycine ligase [Acididesulfobacillus acetoxydans]CAA7600984.1 phosphoribosylamine-glycine ligase [Acididesulfobacillus acetoxydans]CEJ07707.1 Phosphoribosylamine--glycine ligase [Acididesulfobacillus acetoxydans]
MGKKVLIVGSGGREHALAWKLAQSPELSELYVAPGNAGTAQWNVPILSGDTEGLIKFAREKKIDLTVVGPEEPLSRGIVDVFQEAGLRIFGPTRLAARLESSKFFAKLVMREAGIPTAGWEVFEDAAKAKDYIRTLGVPCVLKADGLAAGKGVIVAQSLAEALQAVDEMLGGAFGEAGKRILVEECLEGQEISLLCFADGLTALPMVPVQDHKRALDGDLGLNTGGMGTYSPAPVWTSEVEKIVRETILEPTLKTMREKGMPFTGVLFLGLMLTQEGPKVLEYNVRFGDPETQVVMLRLESDLLPILWSCTEERLSGRELTWSGEAAVCVVMAAPGYPSAYPKGIPIGLPVTLASGEAVFQAGTELRDGQPVSCGGRVLAVTALGGTLAEARERAYGLVGKIDFPGAHFRTDIGVKGL